MPVVEEKLRRDESGAGVHLPFQMLEVFFPRAGFGVLFRIARDPETKSSRAGDLLGQLVGVVESVGMRRKRRLSFRRVAAQGQDVFDPVVRQFLQDGADLRFRVADAGEVSHRLDAEGVFDARHQLQGLRARRASGAIGDRDKVRLECFQSLNRLH